jgi:hypothetical protein
LDERTVALRLPNAGYDRFESKADSTTRRGQHEQGWAMAAFD